MVSLLFMCVDDAVPQYKNPSVRARVDKAPLACLGVEPVQQAFLHEADLVLFPVLIRRAVINRLGFQLRPGAVLKL